MSCAAWRRSILHGNIFFDRDVGWEESVHFHGIRVVEEAGGDVDLVGYGSRMVMEIMNSSRNYVIRIGSIFWNCVC